MSFNLKNLKKANDNSDDSDGLDFLNMKDPRIQQYIDFIKDRN